ncbi:MAG: hypothetical protein ACI9J3_003247, partial [Parvicellaceae bacterium]
MKKFFFAMLGIALLNSCAIEVEELDLGNATDLFDQVYSTDQIASQIHTISNDRDTTLIGENGTVFRIFENTFVDENGEPIVGPVEVEIKEAFDKMDLVMGNLITTADGKLLESGGMVYINATADGIELSMDNNKAIGVAVPTEKVDRKMKIYDAEPCDSEDTPCASMNWTDPKSTLNKKVKTEQRQQYTVWYTPNPIYSEEEMDKFFDYLWSTDLWKSKNKLVKHRGTEIMIKYHTSEPITIITTRYDDGRIVQEVLAPKGVNTFVTDPNTNYIFSMNNLGWTNIDKLQEDKRDEEVEFATNVKNDSAFNTVYVSLIFKDKNVYLNGYQMKNGSYSFARSDSEKMVLPVGQEATLMATAYKEGNPFFAMQYVVIAESLSVDLDLKATTMD